MKPEENKYCCRNQNCHQRQLPPKTTATKDNCYQKPTDNCYVSKTSAAIKSQNFKKTHLTETIINAQFNFKTPTKRSILDYNIYSINAANAVNFFNSAV